MTNPLHDRHNAFLREPWAMNHLNTDLQAKVAAILDEDSREINRLIEQLRGLALNGPGPSSQLGNIQGCSPSEPCDESR